MLKKYVGETILDPQGSRTWRWPMSNDQDFRQPATCKITVKGEEITELYPYLVDSTGGDESRGTSSLHPHL